MKITKSTLQRVIQEELAAVLQETGPYQEQPAKDWRTKGGCDPAVQTCVGPSVQLGSDSDPGGKTTSMIRSYHAGKTSDFSPHSNRTLTGDFQTLLARASEVGDAMDPGMRQHMHDLGQELLARGYPANLVNAQYKTFGINQQQPQYKMQLRNLNKAPGEAGFVPIDESTIKKQQLQDIIQEELRNVLL